jgi:pimeloyl-ACP methyl ester carboxylesterase
LAILKGKMTATAPLPIGPEVVEHVPVRRPWTALGPPDAPGIVFIHGTRLTRAQWLAQVRLLSGRYRCVAVDLPGHGVLGDEPFTLGGASDVVRRAIEAEVASGRAVLVGLSLGGYVAIETAEAHPDTVAGLVLAGCSAEAFGPMALPYRFFRALLAKAPRPAQELANTGFFRLRYRRRIAEPIVEGGFWAAGGAAALTALIGRRYLDRLARLWTPVLVVNGAFDPVFGPQGEYWAASCRRGRHVVIKRAMHLSNLDRPVTFARVVAAFTDEAGRSA